MRFYADLHIHSPYSRATSSRLSVEGLALSAAEKGIAVLGTGDFTHPAWLDQVADRLVEAEPGLFRLGEGGCPTRFVLTAEISTIYKQSGRVRKVHHLVGAPGIAQARRIAAALARVGNILSDGRPILGITSRDLLEIVLEAGEGTFLIPAHIWTPWFSVLGSRSGFDSIAECYLDLEPHVFAVETGLSSDPPMNWMVSGLDRYRLVSCSDAHSTDKLGREATVFDTELDYFAIRAAMATGRGLQGTVEFFPEEGKYHLDGHRECGVVFAPPRTRDVACLCPVCGRELTVGVLHRVEELADRPEGVMPDTARPFHRIIPLAEILAEIMQVSSPTNRVREAYRKVCARLGGELPLLIDADCDDIEREAGPALALAVRRMRSGEVHIEPGYDGKFGRVRVFADNEKDLLFSPGLEGTARRPGSKNRERPEASPRRCKGEEGGKDAPAAAGVDLTEDQRAAVAWREGPLMVVAGPGTGKTRVLVERILSLAADGAGSVLGVTFTTRAAREIAMRLEGAVPGVTGSVTPERSPRGLAAPASWGYRHMGLHVDVCTFHSLAARIVREAGLVFEIADDDLLEQVASPAVEGDVKAWVADLVFRQGTMQDLDPEQDALVRLLASRCMYTYEGLVHKAMEVLEGRPGTYGWDHVMVDEFQDINPLQYAFMKVLARCPRSVVVIGDPHQAIYGFRGSSRKAFADFERDYAPCTTIRLGLTHRFGTYISEASSAVVSREPLVPRGTVDRPVRLVRTGKPTRFIASEIESLCGGLSHRTASAASPGVPLSSMAVIVRTRAQAAAVVKALEDASIPCDTACAGPLAKARGVRERLAVLTAEDNDGFACRVKGTGPCVVERALRFARSLSGGIAERLERIEASSMFDLPPLPADHPFYAYARLFGDDREGFVEFLSLSGDDGGLSGERVHVITAHAAKGLEYRCVFVTGLVQGVFPLDGSDPGEERNLFYVAMTRAQELLYLVCPLSGASRFLDDIPRRCAEETVDGTGKAHAKQMLLFE